METTTTGQLGPRSMMISYFEIARICHEANRAFCIACGDTSQVEWDHCSDELRQSAVQGVINIFQDPETTPEKSHESWIKFKLEHGWKFGPEKNEQEKTHPCIVPYDELPLRQRKKDELFLAIVKCFL
jgi:hypothetical protein